MLSTLSKPTIVFVIPLTVPVKVGEFRSAFDDTSPPPPPPPPLSIAVLFATICANKSAPFNKLDFFNVPVTSIEPLTVNPVSAGLDVTICTCLNLPPGLL